jgi:hypothetical protein
MSAHGHAHSILRHLATAREWLERPDAAGTVELARYNIERAQHHAERVMDRLDGERS